MCFCFFGCYLTPTNPIHAFQSEIPPGILEDIATLKGGIVYPYSWRKRVELGCVSLVGCWYILPLMGSEIR